MLEEKQRNPSTKILHKLHKKEKSLFAYGQYWSQYFQELNSHWNSTKGYLCFELSYYSMKTLEV